VCEKKVRRLMLRLKLEAQDAEVFLGMLRQISWKLRQTRSPENEVHPELRKKGQP
jgi:tRNA C32,U32 (ribose-2'-O)-methylase TrmJ